MKQIKYSIDLDRDFHKRIRDRAYENETAMCTFIIQAVKEKLDKSDSKGISK